MEPASIKEQGDTASPRTLSAEWMLLPGGWHQKMQIEVDIDGRIISVGSASGEIDEDVVVPGMVNAHSHAFQRDLIGRNQRFQHPDDDFWSWRTGMYDLAGSLTPATQEDVAFRAFRDMVRHGYTSVCEFHYTHGALQPTNAEIPVLMAEAVLRAAQRAGIRIRLLPVLYQQGGFGQRPLGRDQRAFGLNTDVYLRMIEHLRTESGLSPFQSIGYAPHSLRAVDLDGLRAVSDHRNDTDKHAPIHIHVAEQVREVNECMLSLRKRPVEWLLQALPVDASWCLIHATHMSESERRSVVERGPTVGLCPTTEADLGDGFFPLQEFIQEGGRWAIGTDSNLSVNPADELRLLDWQHRLKTRRRNAFQLDSSRSAGTFLFQQAIDGGRCAIGQPVGRIEAGAFADLVALNRSLIAEQPLEADETLAAWIHTADPAWIRQVYTGGEPRLTFQMD